MAEKQNPQIGYVVSLCGIMSGLALALMFILGMIPAFEYISPATAGVLIWIIRDRLGVKYGMTSYLTVGILCLLVTPNYEAAMMFLFLLGYYPIIREYLQKIRFIFLRGLTKLAIYAVAGVAAYALLINLFGMSELLDEANEFGKYGTLILFGMGAVAFGLYDRFLGLYKPVYEKIIKPQINKRMGNLR